MSTRQKNRKTTTLDPEGIDRLVISQSDDDSSWDAPTRVNRSKPASLSIPVELGSSDRFWKLIAKRRKQKGISRAKLDEKLNGSK